MLITESYGYLRYPVRKVSSLLWDHIVVSELFDLHLLEMWCSLLMLRSEIDPEKFEQCSLVLTTVL